MRVKAISMYIDVLKEKKDNDEYRIHSIEDGPAADISVDIRIIYVFIALYQVLTHLR